MRILIVGSGGREHALAWKLAMDSRKPRIFCAPGNAGTAELGTNLDIPADDVHALTRWAIENKPDLTVIGPEAPLCAGLVDRLDSAGLRAFGPSAAAARLEGSKVFAKDVMMSAGVPTAEGRSFQNAAEARAYVKEKGLPIVVKADGLAAGKGVTVCSTPEEAEKAIDDALVRRVFGEGGDTILIEECLDGEEASILALIDGQNIVLLASSQDHKRAFDGDKGPNTGGMGAYSPAPIVSDEMWPFIRKEIYERTLKELQRRGIGYRGVLYAGLMMTRRGPMVLEYNCRFGDPETQAVLARWDGDLLPALEACATGHLTEQMVRWKQEKSVCVVMAAGGYPGSYEKGKAISGLTEAGSLDGVVVFHAGTKKDGDSIVTSGGRVLGVTALGSELKDAVSLAYEAVGRIRFDGEYHRKDIAFRALKA